ncbi:hypothetical protein K9U40_20750 [Xanthobacter autotrophicus]|uniref:hypothetical protein n=1 Tax=Xanthobacter TaxID=279 RepID=UPI0024AAD690|nr:hypothetical protein [Xanthobacter autotrophicus]MDI4666730.1 hypothetical protein [Xanthobacter autotrophicus]
MVGKKPLMIWRVLHGFFLVLGISCTAIVVAIFFLAPDAVESVPSLKSQPAVADASAILPTPQPSIPAKEPSSSSPEPGTISEEVFVREAFGCKDWETWKSLGKVAAQGDKEAFAKILYSALALGTCRRFKAGDHVYLSETAIFSASTCMRPKGETACFWVSIDATGKSEQPEASAPATRVAEAPPAPSAPPAPLAHVSPLGGDVGGFAKRFNDKSRSLSAGVRLAKGGCKTEVRTACTYTLTEGVSVVAGSAPDKKTLETLTIHLFTNEQMVVLRYLAGVAVMLHLFAPSAERDEVATVGGQIISQIANGDGADVTLHGVNVKVVLMQPFGSFTSISRR